MFSLILVPSKYRTVHAIELRGPGTVARAAAWGRATTATGSNASAVEADIARVAEGASTAAPLHAPHLRPSGLRRGRVLAGRCTRQPAVGQGLAGLVEGAPGSAHVQSAAGVAEGRPLVNGREVEPAPGRLDMG